MTILGLNAYHGDSAACLFKDGRLVAAAEEERFRRIKHWAGLPTNAIDYCLGEAGVSLPDVEHVAINRKPGVNNWRRLAFVLRHRPDPRLIMQKVRNIRSASSVNETLERVYKISLRTRIHHVEHHLAHLASAFLVSRFEEAACISIDGFGDFASTAMGFGRGSGIEIEQRVYFPHSLGIFYSAMTQFIGFPNFGDEYKVMGLAPLGEPKYLDKMRELVRIQADGTFKLNLKYFRHHTDNVSYSWNDCAPEVGILYTCKLIESRKKEIRNGSCDISRVLDQDELCRRAAAAIANGQVIGWFQGRMEWGPRALGNRSILCDPRRSDMKEILNAKIKRRESFRPFAPSILRESVAEWFEQDDDVPFMMEVFQIRAEKRALIPAVTHVDGSGRLQTVHRETNPLYHQLITTFHELTSILLVLNTSFNENEPVVCRPEEALDCFLRTRMDVLVLGSYFIQRMQ